MDLILNGVAHGNVAAALMQNEFNVNTLRPYIGKDGRTYVTQNRFNRNTGKNESYAHPTQNAAATLRYDDWRQLDTAVLKAARYRLGLVADIRGAGLSYNIPNGLGKTVLTTENMTDPGSATISMDGLRKSEGDRPEFNLVNLPLPITHSDFWFSARQLAVSRNSSTPLDTTMAEAASRRVAEAVEQLFIGTYPSTTAYAFAGASLPGLTNFSSRLTKTITSPTATAWVAKTTITEVLNMRQKSIDAKHYGPWVLYTSTAWDEYMDSDYILNASTANVATQTLRQRIMAIKGIQDVRSLDFLTGYQMILLEMTSEVIRSVIGLDFTTVQWETDGGMKINFKVMAIIVPQVRADAYGNTGIVHGNTA